MHVFVTGLSGFIGQKVLKELLANGHTVLGLARSDASADLLKNQGVEVIRGDLTDFASLAAGAKKCDGVIHLAFHHDFSDMAGASLMDQRAIEAMANVLRGTGKPFVGTSGSFILGGVDNADEDSPIGSFGLHNPRSKSEELVVGLAKEDIRSSVVRLSPITHGEGDFHGFVRILTKIAKDKKESVYIGDGQNVWPSVHVLDAARLYVLALENGVSGSVYHGVAETLPFYKIASTIADKVGVPAVSRPQEAAMEHFGFLGMVVGINNQVSSHKTQKQLNWKPREIGLLEDIEHGEYFR